MEKLYILLLAFLLPTLLLAGGDCPDDMVVYADGPNCTATVILPPIPWGGNCGNPANCNVYIIGQNVTFDGTNWIAHDLHVGWYYVHYESQYPCPHNFHCTMKLKVLSGGGGLSAVCDQNTVVALGQDGVGRVYAETFNDHSNSSCGATIVNIQVRRMNQGWCPPGVKDDTHFGPYVEFCCEDIAASPIQVILRVTDSHGNTNECMVLVHVQDKLPPVIHCLPDITVNCDYPIDLSNLDEFGTIVTDPSQREPIYVNGHLVGYDGYVTDNCGVEISENYWKEFNMCGIGWIKRKFIATDQFGNKTYCVQLIHVKNTDPFDESDINWPDNYAVYGCEPGDLSPDVTGRPTFDSEACSFAAATYDDLVFQFGGSACMKILRQWKVLDWCSYNRYTGAGWFTNTQVIMVIDNKAPVFLDCSDVVLTTDSCSGCKGYVNLYPEVEDCTPSDKIAWTVWIDYHNDGTVDKVVNHGDLTGFIPFGTHKITWQADDLCLNRSKCTKLVTIKDNQAPVPVCHNNIATVIIPECGFVRINAGVHDAGSYDNCTASEDLHFSFSPDITDTTRMFTCDDLGINRLPVYVTDENGNQSVCYVNLEIQDNSGYCLDSLTTHIAGRVTTSTGEGVNDVHFSIIHPIFGQYLITSDEHGYFSYASHTDLSEYDSVLIMPLRADHPLNGVTAYDLFYMFKINLGEFDFDNPYQMIAADINNDGRFSSIDLAGLKQLLLGKTQDFQANISWRFVNEMVPMNQDEPLNFVEAQYVSIPEFNSQFIGVKIGDINLSANPSKGADGRSSNEVTFKVKEQYVNAGEQVEVKVQIPENVNPVAFQLYLKNYGEFNIEKLQYSSEDVNSLVTPDYAGIVYFGGAEKSKSEISFSFTPSTGGYLSEMIKLSELHPSLLADGEETERPINLRFVGRENTTDFTVNIVPNPVVNTADIYITSEQKQDASIRIYNVNGSLMLEKDISLEIGKNKLSLNSEIHSYSSGVYYLRVVSKENVVQETFVKM